MSVARPLGMLRRTMMRSARADAADRLSLIVVHDGTHGPHIKSCHLVEKLFGGSRCSMRG
jgi:hypothetical protein